MFKKLCDGTRIYIERKYNISRQSERYQNGEKWKEFVHNEFKTHKYQIFFAQDRIDKEEVGITYCPTELMLADYYTKPLDGSLFRKLRAIITGHSNIMELFQNKHTLKDRVEI